MATTTRLSLRYPVASDTADVPRDIGNLASDIDKAAIFSKGTFSARPTSTVGSPGIDGRYYFATDTSRLYLDTGTSWVEVASGTDSVTSAMIADGAVATADLADASVTSAKLAAGATSATYGTSLPGSPVDGQEYYYAADATNGVIWHFRYRSAASKWEFVGGPPLVATVATQQSTSSGTYAALTTAGPSIALPLAGDYDVKISARVAAIDNFGASAAGYMSYDIGATGAVDADAIIGYGPYTNATSIGNAVMAMKRQTSLSAVTLTCKYKGSASGTATFVNRVIAVTPVRV